MVPVLSLWVPILLSAIIVFVVSAVIHMVLTYHRNDFRRLPKEDDVLEALRRLNVPPGDYAAPYAASPAGMKDPAFLERMNKGPVVIMTVAPGGPPAMGTALSLWFVYSIGVSVFSAYIAGRALGPGAHYLEVFRFVGTAAFMGYAFAQVQQSIWFKRNWGTTVKAVFDGLLYALLTAGTFGWLWPG
jgi:hypothetical protein